MKSLRFTEPIATFKHEVKKESESDTLGFIVGLIILASLVAFLFYFLGSYIQKAFT